MAIVNLPGLKEMMEEISKLYNLPKSAVHEALREALIKGYERYRRAQNLDKNQFHEDYFTNFEVELDVDE
jgi:N utilization substance protein A